MGTQTTFLHAGFVIDVIWLIFLVLQTVLVFFGHKIHLWYRLSRDTRRSIFFVMFVSVWGSLFVINMVSHDIKHMDNPIQVSDEEDDDIMFIPRGTGFDIMAY